MFGDLRKIAAEELRTGQNRSDLELRGSVEFDHSMTAIEAVAVTLVDGHSAAVRSVLAV